MPRLARIVYGKLEVSGDSSLDDAKKVLFEIFEKLGYPEAEKELDEGLTKADEEHFKTLMKQSGTENN